MREFAITTRRRHRRQLRGRGRRSTTTTDGGTKSTNFVGPRKTEHYLRRSAARWDRARVALVLARALTHSHRHVAARACVRVYVRPFSRFSLRPSVGVKTNAQYQSRLAYITLVEVSVRVWCACVCVCACVGNASRRCRSCCRGSARRQREAGPAERASRAARLRTLSVRG